MDKTESIDAYALELAFAGLVFGSSSAGDIVSGETICAACSPSARGDRLRRDYLRKTRRC